LSLKRSLYDWLSLILPIQKVTFGSNRSDILDATAEGELVLGLGGDDRISSTFNRAALVGGKGDDALITVLDLESSSDPIAGKVVQLGDGGADSLDATVTLITGGGTIDVHQDGGTGDDTINARVTAPAPSQGSVTATIVVNGGRGNDVINVVNDSDIIVGDSVVSNKINGGQGHDRITVLAGTQFGGLDGTAINEISGGDGHDVIDATAVANANSADLASNIIHAGRGNDLAMSFFNSETPLATSMLDGGSGNDTLLATVDGRGTNLLRGGSGDDRLTAGPETCSTAARERMFSREASMTMI
jgi:serralysin